MRERGWRVRERERGGRERERGERVREGKSVRERERWESEVCERERERERWESERESGRVRE